MCKLLSCLGQRSQGLLQDPYTVPLLSPGRHVEGKRGGLAEKTFSCHILLCVVHADVFRGLHENTVQST